MREDLSPPIVIANFDPVLRDVTVHLISATHTAIPVTASGMGTVMWLFVADDYLRAECTGSTP